MAATEVSPIFGRFTKTPGLAEERAALNTTNHDYKLEHIHMDLTEKTAAFQKPHEHRRERRREEKVTKEMGLANPDLGKPG